MKPLATPCNPPPSFTKPGCGWAATTLPSFQDRAHFLGAAAEAMRRILIERARRKIAAKRGAGAAKVDLDEIEIPAPVAGIAVPTAKQWWAYARAWLTVELRDEATPLSPSGASTGAYPKRDRIAARHE